MLMLLHLLIFLSALKASGLQHGSSDLLSASAKTFDNRSPERFEEPLTDEACQQKMRPGTPTLVFLRAGKDGFSFQSLWEKGLIHELLGKVGPVLFCELQGWVQGALDVLSRSGDDPVGFIVGGWPYNAQVRVDDLFLNVVSHGKKKPRLLIHLSDEVGTFRPDIWYPRLVAEDGLVLREYQHWDWSLLPTSPRVRIMPLGYNSGLRFPHGSCAVAHTTSKHLPADRHHLWACVGTLHATQFGNRTTLLEQLMGPGSSMSNAAGQVLDTSEYFISNALQPTKMMDAYEDSIFAPNLPGGETYECFRIYEAVIAGAIPVIVGPEDETRLHFAYHGAIHADSQTPPFLFATSFAEARTQMLALSKDPNRLKSLSAKLAPWWCSWLESLQAEVAEVLRSPDKSE